MPILQIILTIVLTLLLITVLVFVHELGHFMAAKFFKVDVKEFAIGFGKKVASRKYRGTVYAIRLFPLGGFVDLEGETKSTSANSFRNIAPYKKVIILSAGVIMNLIFAAVAMTVFLASNNYQFVIPALTEYNFHNTLVQVEAYPLMVTEVSEEGNSYGQLEEGDVIIGIDGVRFSSYQEFQELLKQNQGETVVLEFMNLDTFETSTQEVNIGYADEEGAILNVSLVELNRSSASVAYPAYYLKYPSNLTAGTSLTLDLCLYIPKSLVSIISNSFKTGDFSELGNSVGGPLQIVDQSNTIVQSGLFSAFVPLAALLSISLAIFNILPFPALDGGQIVVVLLETATRRKVPDSVLEKINMVGLIMLFSFAAIITFKDFLQLNVISKLGELLSNIF